MKKHNHSPNWIYGDIIVCHCGYIEYTKAENINIIYKPNKQSKTTLDNNYVSVHVL